MSATAEGGSAHAALPTRGWSAAAAGVGHAAAVYSTTEALLAATTPFLEEGLRAGDLVVLACPPELAAIVSEPLGEQAGSVEADSRICLLGTRPPDAFAITGRLLARAASAPSGRVRVVRQVQFDDVPGGPREGLRYEIAANAVLAGAPLSAICLYDTRVLPDSLVAQAVEAHPQLVVGDGLADNHRYREPASLLRSLPIPSDPVEAGAPLLSVEHATALPEVRHRLRAALAGVVTDPDQREDLTLAVSEIAANAFRHGRPPVSARLWADGSRLVCILSDCGPGYDQPLAGFLPAHGEDLAKGGMGLWLARKLWDQVDLLPGGPGLTVRLSVTLHEAASGAAAISH